MQWTVKAAAKELGIHADTLAKGLIRSGLTVERGSRFTTLEVFRGYMGDLKAEQTRKTRLEADAKELENKVRLGELIETARAKAIYGEIASVCRTFVAVELGQIGAEANPSDPEHGRELALSRGRQFLERLTSMEQTREPAVETSKE